MEVSRDGKFKCIKGMRRESLGTPRSSAGAGGSTGRSNIGTNNPALVRDMFLTLVTGYIQFPEPLLAPLPDQPRSEVSP